MRPTIDQTILNTELKQFNIDIQKWNASIYFIENEIQFITKKLHSYLFEPTTPNLFELWQEFKFEITAIEEEWGHLKTEIQKHENVIKMILPFDGIEVEGVSKESHESLTLHYNTFYNRFNTLKVKVLGHIGGVLDHNKKQILQTI